MTFPALVELSTLYSVCTICSESDQNSLLVKRQTDNTTPGLLPYVGNIGTIGTNGITNGTIGKTLNGICLPMVPFLPLERTTNARYVINNL